MEAKQTWFCAAVASARGAPGPEVQGPRLAGALDGGSRGCSPGAWEPVRSSPGSVSRYAALSLVTFSQPSSGSAVCCQVTKSGSSQRPWGAAPTTSGSARGGARLSRAGPHLRLSQGASKVSAGTKCPRVSPGAGATAQRLASEDRALGGCMKPPLRRLAPGRLALEEREDDQNQGTLVPEAQPGRDSLPPWLSSVWINEPPGPSHPEKGVPPLVNAWVGASQAGPSQAESMRVVVTQLLCWSTHTPTCLQHTQAAASSAPRLSVPSLIHPILLPRVPALLLLGADSMVF